MSFDWETILQSLGGKRAGTLNTASPGTGPYQRDTTTTQKQKPMFLGGTPIPATKPQDDTGYGGDGDPTPPTAPYAIEARPRVPAIPGAFVPRLNKLYGPLRTEGDTWRFVNRGIASGTWTPVTGAQAAIPVTLTQSNPVFTKLSQYPDAISLYWILQFFSFAPVASTMTGSQSIVFQPNNGDNAIPLGVWQGSQSGQIISPILVDAPVTDASQTTIGNLYVTGNTIATAAVCAWQIGVGVAYLLPTPLFGLYESSPTVSQLQRDVHNDPTGERHR